MKNLRERKKESINLTLKGVHYAYLHVPVSKLELKNILYNTDTAAEPTFLVVISVTAHFLARIVIDG